ncbi:hypothetical protein ANN_09657 [Periplaneta americana]|uniref:Uncharacterized protein n=1 Tax=Periplaneta americana TaxID=6978 RepID=A0ABQ8TPI2_PERAM|nr:hypothetical protein ANN_09657 [Periplaneta americana]
MADLYESGNEPPGSLKAIVFHHGCHFVHEVQVVNALQSTILDIVKVSQYIQRIVEMIRHHREDEQKITDEMLKEDFRITEQLGLDLNIPRIVGRQQHRSNHPAENSSEFWRRSLIIPYLVSTISLELRFSIDDTIVFAHVSLLMTIEMSIKTFDDLLNLISHKIRKTDTVMRKSVHPVEKLLVTLRWRYIRNSFILTKKVHGFAQAGPYQRIDTIAIPTDSSTEYIIDLTVRTESYET